MSVEATIQTIEKALEGRRLSEFAREADLPYTTLRDWQARGWRNNHVETFDKIAAAARRILDSEADKADAA